MSHTISMQGQRGCLSYLQRLWNNLFTPGIGLERKLEQLFAVETDEFGLDHAFFTYIDLEAEVQHFEVVHGSHTLLKPGKTVPLTETYCRKTIADPEGTVAISDARVEGWAGDPAYETFDLGSYLGTTVPVRDGLYGTLCFTSTEPRGEPITDEEKRLVEMLGQWVTYELNQRVGLAANSAVSESDEHGMSSTQIDMMISALGNPIRRSILFTLVDTTGERSIDSITRQIDVTNAGVKLHHNHLPKLDEAGYIEWDHTTNTISRGRRFVEVEPFVRLLKEYRTGFVGSA